MTPLAARPTISDIFEFCLQLTGRFEGAAPRYDTITGNFDSEGISVGILQWNAGQGTLSLLLQAIAHEIGWVSMNTTFKAKGGESVDLEALAALSPKEAVASCKSKFMLADSTGLDATSENAWKALLNLPGAVLAQRNLAMSGTFARAQRQAKAYFPEHVDHPRVLAFFFDLCTQEGSMNGVPMLKGASPSAAIAFAKTQNLETGLKWQEVATSDPLAGELLYYAFERVRLSRVQYWWDSLSRRGTIACRIGLVHGVVVELTTVLP